MKGFEQEVIYKMQKRQAEKSHFNIASSQITTLRIEEKKITIQKFQLQYIKCEAMCQNSST